jgi:hypothetical protein
VTVSGFQVPDFSSRYRNKATCWTTGVRFPVGAGKWFFFLFAIASRPVQGPSKLFTQWVLVDLSSGVKRPGREANHSAPSSVKVKNVWSYTPTHLYVFISWCLVKQPIQCVLCFTVCVMNIKKCEILRFSRRWRFKSSSSSPWSWRQQGQPKPRFYSASQARGKWRVRAKYIPRVQTFFYCA